MINTMKSLLALCLFYSAASVSTAETPIKHTSFRPGEIWTDNNGAHINAHGGGILYDKGTYYWYGEHKVEGDAGNYAQVGVHCYSSKDLYNWKDEGIALKVVEGDHSHQGLHPGTPQSGLQQKDRKVRDVVSPGTQGERIWIRLRGGGNGNKTHRAIQVPESRASQSGQMAPEHG